MSLLLELRRVSVPKNTVLFGKNTVLFEATPGIEPGTQRLLQGRQAVARLMDSTVPLVRVPVPNA